MSDEIIYQIKRDASQYMVEHQKKELGVSPRNGFYLGFQEGAKHQHPIAFENGRMQGKFEAIDHILESLESGQIQTWAATVHHLKVLKEAAVKQLEAMRK
jgi:hypothetical protein